MHNLNGGKHEITKEYYKPVDIHCESVWYTEMRSPLELEKTEEAAWWSWNEFDLVKSVTSVIFI